jgi:hypothetical protein
MKSRADTLEKVIGRRATSCLGVGLLLVILALVTALLWPKFFPKPQPAPDDKISR